MGIEYDPEEPQDTDCEIEGEHDWKTIATAPDGTKFVKCKLCGVTDEH